MLGLPVLMMVLVLAEATLLPVLPPKLDVLVMDEAGTAVE
jgi:hypothetical protein